MTRNRKIAVSVGVLALLLGIGVNMQVSALAPNKAKSTDIQKDLSNAKDDVKENVSKEDKTTLEVKDSTIYVGDKWEPQDNVIKAIDRNGDAIKIEDLHIDHVNLRPGQTVLVDTNRPGINGVSYTIIDCCTGKKTTKTVKVTVKERLDKDKELEDRTSITVRNSTIYVGDKWQAADNLVSATDKDGEAVDIKNIDVDGRVNNEKAGSNKVRYTILNRTGEKVSKEAIITVLDDKTSLKVKDSTIYVGDKWQAIDNLVKATGIDGGDLDMKNIEVEGSVDTTKAGNNEVVYVVVNRQGKKIIKKADITVIDRDNDDNNNVDKDKDKDNTGDKDNDENNNVDDNKDNKDDNIGIGGDSGSDDGGAQLPKTGYDISIITGLIGLAGALGGGSIYLRRRQSQE